MRPVIQHEPCFAPLCAMVAVFNVSHSVSSTDIQMLFVSICCYIYASSQSTHTFPMTAKKKSTKQSECSSEVFLTESSLSRENLLDWFMFACSTGTTGSSPVPFNCIDKVSRDV